MLRCCSYVGFLTLLGGVAAAPLQAQGHVLVVDVGEVGTGAFLPGVEVMLPDARIVARTNWQGEAVLHDLPARPLRVQVRRFGYASSDITIPITGDTSSIFFSLERLATLDTVRVTADSVPGYLQEFATRRRLGIGRFLSDSVLEAEHAMALPILFAQRLPGVRIMPDPESRARLTVNCRLYLDGFAYPGALEDIQPAELAGVEYYDSRAMLPVLYRDEGAPKESTTAPRMHEPNDQCTILMWSKWY